MTAALNQLFAAKISPAALSGGVRLSGSQAPTLEKTAGPETDVFVKSETPAATQQPSAPAAALKKLLTENANRKANAIELYKTLTGIQPWKSELFAQARPEQQAEVKQLAETIRQMSPAEKLDLMKQVTGPESPYSKVAESILINQKLPNVKDLFNCAKPQIQDKGLSGVAAGIQAAGMGLLLLPVVAPASMLFRPELLGQFAAGLATFIL